MNFKTLTHVKDYDFKINFRSNILSLGSCFSQEISQKLSVLKYKVTQNPCGITFNPTSILSCIKTCKSKESLPLDTLIKTSDLYAHPNFHGSFNHPDPQQVISNINNSRLTANKRLQTVDCVILTLGTAFVFKRKDSGTVVNNCHKLPNDLFDRVMLTNTEIYRALQDIKSEIESFSDVSPRFIITLSPVRHIRDGLIANQRSKAVALTAIHDFVDHNENVDYFPAYEILLDELRDYRFYKDDMIHPSPLAVDYVYSIFEKHLLDDSESKLRQEIAKINTGLNHRSLHPEGIQHQAFKKQLLKKIEMLENQYSYLDFGSEKLGLI